MSEFSENSCVISATTDAEIHTINVTSISTANLNLGYLVSVRGILNILQMVFGLIVVIMLGHLCQFEFPSVRNVVFLCDRPDACAFVVALVCCSVSFLHFLFCLIYEKYSVFTASVSYDLVIAVLFSLLYLVTSAVFLGELLKRNKDFKMGDKEGGFSVKISSAAFGLTNFVCYGINAVWLLYTTKIRKSTALERKEEMRNVF